LSLNIGIVGKEWIFFGLFLDKIKEVFPAGIVKWFS